MVKTVAAKTRKAIVRAAQHSAEKIRAVAADAASAATQAAAGVVLASTASALEGAVRKSRNPHPASKSASGELNDPQRARSRKGLLDVAGGAWQDLGDLIQAELELLRAEISEKLTLTAWSASLIGGGAVLLVATLLLLLQAAIGALVALGVSWLAAVLIVAAVTLVLGGSLVWSGFNNLAHRLTPTKTIAQVQKDAKALTGSE